MERKLILAIALSLLVLLVWSRMVSRYYPIENKGVTTEEPQQLSSPEITPSSLPAQPEPAPPEQTIKFLTEKTELEFSERQAAIKSVSFREYRSAQFPLRQGFQLGAEELHFTLAFSTSQEIVFRHQDETKEIIKQFSISNVNYAMELQIKVRNLSPAALELELPLILAELDFSTHNPEARYQEVVFFSADKTLRPSPLKETRLPEIKYAGVRERYFCLVVEPAQKEVGAFIKKSSLRSSVVGISSGKMIVPPGSQIGHKFLIYLGPQELKYITAINQQWAGLIHYGTFDLISQVLLKMLKVFYMVVHNWGLAIIILSLAVYFLLFPLTLKQMRSMKEMQVLQPKIEALRKAHKDNPQKLNKEIMQLYREHKVNPLGGCLPLILQMPIFFALYNGLMRSISLKGAIFLWIKDLAEPDRLKLPFALPILGKEINLLPILMALMMFWQQKETSLAASGTSAEQQKMMTLLFPLMFGFIFYRMPSGLVLYWLVNTTMMLVYQLRITRTK